MVLVTSSCCILRTNGYISPSLLKSRSNNRNSMVVLRTVNIEGLNFVDDDKKKDPKKNRLLSSVTSGVVQGGSDDDLRRLTKPNRRTKNMIDKFNELTDAAPPLKRNPKRKICLMIEPTPFTHVSGYANRFKEMLKFLSKAGDDVEILTVDSKTKPSKLPKEYEGYSIKHTQGFTFPLYNQISLSMDLPEMKGARIIESFRPDLIHVTSPGFLSIAALFYARVMCIPLVMSYHTHLPSYGKNYLGFVPGIESICWEYLRWAHSRADLTLVTSPQMKDELVANGIPRVSIWRKGIDTERFHPSFQSPDMRNQLTDGNPEDFLLIYVGRLGAEKRVKDIKAMLDRCNNNNNKNNRRRVRLAVVGKGPYEEELKQHFQGTDTIFTGQLSGDELSKAFASADAFVMPSDSETLGFVVLESMASGVPVIGCNAGGIPSIIDDDQTGYLVDPGDVDTYVQKIQLLQNNPKLCTKMGKDARKEAERWGWEAATSVLRNVQYERALLNFHSRAFGGFGRPGTRGMWRLFQWRVRRVVQKLRFPRRFVQRFALFQKRTTDNPPMESATATNTGGTSAIVGARVQQPIKHKQPQNQLS